MPFVGCSEDPTLLDALSTQFTDVDVTILIDTIEAVSATTFRQYLPMNGTVNLAGRSPEGHEAYALLQFPSSQFPQRDTIDVLSAQLTLHAATWFGDSSGTLSLKVHKILRSWSPFSLTWDTLQSGGFFEDAIVRGEFNGGITADTEDVVVTLDTAMVRQWLQPDDFTQYGILLKPEIGSTIVRGFTGFGLDPSEYDPKITVVARNIAGTVTDTTEYSLGSDTFAGNYDPGLLNDRIATQAGVVYRTKIMFDASAIPTGAIINKADLILTPILSAISKFSADTLLATHVLTTATADSSFEFTGSIAVRGAGSTLTFDMRHAAQLWVNGTNNGVILRSSTQSEFSTLDLHVFFGLTAVDPTVRPLVRVLYSVEKELGKR